MAFAFAMCKTSRRKDAAGTHGPQWQPDSEAKNCGTCNKRFSSWLRRHHCRNCGMCVCGYCSPSKRKVDLPKYGYNKSVRVCRDCHEMCTNADELYSAIQGNGWIAVNNLLSQGHDPNFSTTLFSPLMVAAGKGFTKLMDLMVEHKADVNYQVPSVNTPVYVTCEDCGKKSAYDYNPLHRYMCHVCEQSTEFVSVGHSSTGMAPIHAAAAHGHSAAIVMLLEHGVSINTKTGNANTPLMAAVMRKHPDVVELLIERGADVNVANVDLETALHMAVENDDAECVDMLLTAGADVSARNCRDLSPSMLADETGAPDVCAALAAHARRAARAANGDVEEEEEGAGFVPEDEDPWIARARKLAEDFTKSSSLVDDDDDGAGGGGGATATAGAGADPDDDGAGGGGEKEDTPIESTSSKKKGGKKKK